MKIVREPARVVASVFALCAFVVALGAGWRAGASSTQALLSATLCMGVCALVGMWAGWAGDRAIKDFIERYGAQHPVPDVKEAERALHRPVGVGGVEGVESRVKKGAA